MRVCTLLAPLIGGVAGHPGFSRYRQPLGIPGQRVSLSEEAVAKRTADGA